MATLEEKSKTISPNILTKLKNSFINFYESLKIPRYIKKEGPEAVEFYKNMKIPSHITGKQIKLYRGVRTILNTPWAKQEILGKQRTRTIESSVYQYRERNPQVHPPHQNL